jgi:hypothetical protein
MLCDGEICDVLLVSRAIWKFLRTDKDVCLSSSWREVCEGGLIGLGQGADRPVVSGVG